MKQWFQVEAGLDKQKNQGPPRFQTIVSWSPKRIRERSIVCPACNLLRLSKCPHDKCLLSKHCWPSSQTILKVEFYPQLVRVRVLEKRPTWEGLALSANPNQLRRLNCQETFYWTSSKRGNKKRNCWVSHADFACRKQNYLCVCSLAFYVCVP